VIAGTVVLILGLNIWFRHSDRQLRRRLAQTRAARAGVAGFAEDGVFIPDIAPEADQHRNGESGA
jgi:hypothetical protein